MTVAEAGATGGAKGIGKGTPMPFMSLVFSLPASEGF